MLFHPMPLTRRVAPFTHPDWLFEIKWDGFRALLYSEKDSVRLVSRNGNTFKAFSICATGLLAVLAGRPTAERRRMRGSSEVPVFFSSSSSRFKTEASRSRITAEPHPAQLLPAFELDWAATDGADALCSCLSLRVAAALRAAAGAHSVEADGRRIGDRRLGRLSRLGRSRIHHRS